MGLMTLQEVAIRLRVTTKTIYRLLEAHGIPAKKVGRQWRFDQELIDIWLSQKSGSKVASILVIDDEEEICTLFQDALEESGHVVSTITDPIKAIEMIKSLHYDLVFLDLKMPGMNGAELFGHIRKAKPDLPVTVITGFPDSDLMMKALAHGPLGVIKKPFRGADILAAVDSYLRFGTPTK
jgi:excisionase family DNA binding protein